MADTTEKKTYLLNIESNLKKYIDEVVKAKQEVEKMKATVDALKESKKTEGAEWEQANAKLRTSQKEYNTAKSLLDSFNKGLISETNSRKQLNEILKLQQYALGKLGDGYIKDAKGVLTINPLYIEQTKRVRETKEAIIMLDKAQLDGRSSVGLYSEAIEGALGKFQMIPGPVGTAATAVKGFGASLKVLAANPVGAIIMVIVGAVTALIGIFKKFSPVVEAVERILSGLKAVFSGMGNAIIGLITGQKTLGETFRNLGKDIKTAYDEGVKWRQLEQDLFEMTTENAIADAKRKTQMDELLLASRNRSKSETERMQLIGQALLLEEVQFSERKKIADAEVEIAKQAIIMGMNLTEAQKKELDKRGVAYANELKML
jgi:hypothetical protein